MVVLGLLCLEGLGVVSAQETILTEHPNGISLNGDDHVKVKDCVRYGVNFEYVTAILDSFEPLSSEECQLACYVREDCYAWRVSELSLIPRTHCELVDSSVALVNSEVSNALLSSVGGSVICSGSGKVSTLCGGRLQRPCTIAEIFLNRRTNRTEQDELQLHLNASGCLMPSAQWSSVEDIGSGFLVNAIDECQLRCREQEDCIAFSVQSPESWFLGSAGLCHLHSAVGIPEFTTSPGVYIGTNTCAPTPSVADLASISRALHMVIGPMLGDLETLSALEIEAVGYARQRGIFLLPAQMFGGKGREPEQERGGRGRVGLRQPLESLSVPDVSAKYDMLPATITSLMGQDLRGLSVDVRNAVELLFDIVAGEGVSEALESLLLEIPDIPSLQTVVDLSRNTLKGVYLELGYQLSTFEGTYPLEKAGLISDLKLLSHVIEGAIKDWGFLKLDDFFMQRVDLDAMEQAMSSIEGLDFADMGEAMEQAMSSLEGLDFADMGEAMEQAMGSIEGSIEGLDFADMGEAMEQAMEQAMSSLEGLDFADMGEAMEQAMGSIEGLDSAAMEAAMEAAMGSLEVLDSAAMEAAMGSLEGLEGLDDMGEAMGHGTRRLQELDFDENVESANNLDFANMGESMVGLEGYNLSPPGEIVNPWSKEYSLLVSAFSDMQDLWGDYGVRMASMLCSGVGNSMSQSRELLISTQPQLLGEESYGNTGFNSRVPGLIRNIEEYIGDLESECTAMKWHYEDFLGHLNKMRAGFAGSDLVASGSVAVKILKTSINDTNLEQFFDATNSLIKRSDLDSLAESLSASLQLIDELSTQIKLITVRTLPDKIQGDLINNVLSSINDVKKEIGVCSQSSESVILAKIEEVLALAEINAAPGNVMEPKWRSLIGHLTLMMKIYSDNLGGSFRLKVHCHLSYLRGYIEGSVIGSQRKEGYGDGYDLGYDVGFRKGNSLYEMNPTECTFTYMGGFDLGYASGIKRDKDQVLRGMQAVGDTELDLRGMQGVGFLSKSQVEDLWNPLSMEVRCLGAEKSARGSVDKCGVLCQNGVGILDFEVYFKFQLGRSQSRIMPAIVVGLCEEPELNVTGEPSESTHDFVAHGVTFMGEVGEVEGVLSIMECDEKCKRSELCSSWTFTAQSCLLQGDGVLLDHFSVEGDVCQAQCDEDAECISAQTVAAVCGLIEDATVGYEYVNLPKGIVGAVGPVGNSWPGKKPLGQGFEFTVDLSTPGPGLDGTPGDLLSYKRPAVMPDSCRQGFTEHGELCLFAVDRRGTRLEAVRGCADDGGWLYSPTTKGDLETVCGMIGGCGARASLGRDVYWTGAHLARGRLTLEPADQVWVGDVEDIVDASEYEADLGHCIFFNSGSRAATLQRGPCDAYCVPAEDGEEVGQCGNMGHLALVRRPAICAYPKSGLYPERSRVEGRILTSEDEGTQVCAVEFADFNGGDLWKVEVNNWLSCHHGCESTPQCEVFTWSPPYCILNRKGNNGLVQAFTVELEATLLGADAAEDMISLQHQCERICMANPECNGTGEAVSGTCYHKTKVALVFNPQQWMPLVSGPVPCDNLPQIPEPPVVPSVNCPQGYYTVGEPPICARTFFKRSNAIQAQRICEWYGGTLAELLRESDSRAIVEAICDYEGRCAQRGIGTGDGIYYIGLAKSNEVGDDGNATWWWPSQGKEIRYEPRFHYSRLFMNQERDLDPQSRCSYVYPRHHWSGEVAGGWGTEECDFRCQQTPSSYNNQAHSPACGEGEGRSAQVARFFVCTAPTSSSAFQLVLP